LLEKLEWIIFYFEGTCEFCLGNIGIEKYRKEVDEILAKLNDYSDEIRVRAYFASAVIDYKLDKCEQAFDHWQKALTYARQIEDQLYIGKIYSYLAIYFYVKKNSTQETFYFKEAERIFKEQQQYGELAAHYINILWYKRYEKDPREAIEYMDKALYYVQLSDSKKNARIYLHLGYIHKTIFNDFIQAIEHLIKSMELSRENGFVEMESMTMNVLADGYSKIDKLSETVKIYTTIMQNDRYRNITANLKAAVLCNLVSCYLNLKDAVNAEKYLIELEGVLPGVQTNIWERYYAVMLGLKAELCCLKNTGLKSALVMVQESKRIYEKYRNNFVVDEFAILTASRTGDIFLGLGDFVQAGEYYEKMMELTPKDNIYYLKVANERLAAVSEKIGDYDKALSYYKECSALLQQFRKNKIKEQYETLHKHFVKYVKEKEIGALNEQNIILEKDSNLDCMTNLYNRNYLSEYINCKGSSLDIEEYTSILMIDIDSFKAYNDHFGHEKGDRLLQRVAAVLRRCCSGVTDKLIRYGGEEFLVILEGSPKSVASEISEKILKAMEEEKLEHPYSGVKPYLTVSIGIATCFSGGRCNTQKVIEAADQALFCSKRNGKNRFTHIDSMCECNF